MSLREEVRPCLEEVPQKLLSEHSTLSITSHANLEVKSSHLNTISFMVPRWPNDEPKHF